MFPGPYGFLAERLPGCGLAVIMLMLAPLLLWAEPGELPMQLHHPLLNGISTQHSTLTTGKPSPTTRCRAIDTVPTAPMITYYSQRASDGGLMIAEATCIMPSAHG